MVFLPVYITLPVNDYIYTEICGRTLLTFYYWRIHLLRRDQMCQRTSLLKKDLIIDIEIKTCLFVWWEYKIYDNIDSLTSCLTCRRYERMIATKSDIHTSLLVVTFNKTRVSTKSERPERVCFMVSSTYMQGRDFTAQTWTPFCFVNVYHRKSVVNTTSFIVSCLWTLVRQIWEIIITWTELL